MIVRWVAFGDSRGRGHAHETVVAAWRCAAGDERDPPDAAFSATTARGETPRRPVERG